MRYLIQSLVIILFTSFSLTLTAQNTETLFTKDDLRFTLDFEHSFIQDSILERTIFYDSVITICDKEHHVYVDNFGGERYLRFEEGKVFDSRPNVFSAGCNEYFLFDFDLEVGDVFYSGEEWDHLLYDEEIRLTVISKMNIQLLDGVDRIYMELRNNNDPDKIYEWVEGIGDFQLGAFEMSLRAGKLRCVKEEDTSVYITDDFSEEECIARDCRFLDADFSFELEDNISNFNYVANESISYTWDFGDGITSTEATPTHIYTEPGCYPVTLKLENACGVSDSSSRYLSVCKDSLWTNINDRSFDSVKFGSEAIGLATSNHTLLKTIDGGLNWNEIDGPETLGTTYLDYLVMLDDQTIFLSLFDDLGDSFHMSYDGGESWTKTFEDAQVFRMDFDGDNIFVWSRDFILLSTDKGLNWQQTPPIIDLNVRFVQVIGDVVHALGFFDGDKAYVRSDDLGQSMQIIPLPADVIDTYSVHFIDDQTGFLGHVKGISKTTDGGETWDLVELQEDAAIFKIEFQDALRGWASGPRLYGTSNGGETWELEHCENHATFVYSRIYRDSPTVIGNKVYAHISGKGLYNYNPDNDFNCNLLATDDFNSKDDNLIFPNPTTGKLQVQSSHSQGYAIVTNLNGQVIKKTNFFNTSFEMDLFDLSSGLYILELVGYNKRSKLIKFVKM